MKYLKLIILGLALCPLAVISQKKLTLEDASGMNRAIFPAPVRNLQWIGSSDFFGYTESESFLKRKVTATDASTLLTLAALNQMLAASGLDSLTRLPSMKWQDDFSFTFTSKNTVLGVNLKSKTITRLNEYPENAENLDFHEDLSLLAYTVGNNLFIARNGVQLQVTFDEEPGIVNGQTVHRNEFGIDKGTFWSPDGKFLAYYRKDETMVTDYPLVNIDTRIATVENIKYPMAGMTSEQVTLVVFTLATGEHVSLKTGGPADQYLTSVTWGPDSKTIYTAILNRGQNHLKLNKYDAAGGNLLSTLFEEKDDKYVEPKHPLYFLDSDPSQFLWLSERDGYQHLYLYKTDGTLIRQLTRGPWVVTRYLGADPAGASAFFLSTMNSPLNEDIFSVNLRNGKILQLSRNNGTHSPIMNKNGRYFLDNYTDTLVYREYSVNDTKGKTLQVIQRNDDPLDNYARCKVNIFRLRASDGTDLYSRLILPADFDPGKKYPAIVYVYGGPHAQLVTNSWLGGASLFLYYLAQQGYVIFTLDNRGSANRGMAFEQALFRNMGSVEVEDQVTGARYLQNLSFVDENRIGVHGWSYGGFMTIALMLKEPGVFRTGVCGGPVTDWQYYEVMYGERYMDTPEENPEGYEASSLLKIAGNLQGDLLVIHGTADPVVVWQHSLALMKRFIEEGVQADYFIYPGHGHGVGGKDRVHLNRKIEKYFFDHL